MSELNIDIEAGLGSQRRLSPISNDQAQLLENSSETQQSQNIEEQFRNTQNSITFVLASLFVPVPKILASLWVLLFSDYPCFGVKQTWLAFMMLHDAFHTYIILLRIKTILAIARFNSNSNGSSGSSNNNNIISQGIQLTAQNSAGIAPQQGEDQAQDEAAQRNNRAAVMNEILQKQEHTKKLTTYGIYFWMILFLWWMNMDSLQELGACDNESVNDLITIFILMAWVWLLNPLIICCLGCLCLPVLLIVVCVFGRPNQLAATRAEILNLPVKEYTPDLPGSGECAICIVEYQQGDKLIQLQCSSLHHFHEDCLKNWLKINGQCPICRARVGEKRNDTPNSTHNHNESSDRLHTH